MERMNLKKVSSEIRAYVRARIIDFKEKGYKVKEIGEFLNVNVDYVYQVLKKYQLKMPLTTITEYLNRWGMTCQRPAKQATKQNEAAVKEFQEVTFPKIVAQAKKEKIHMISAIKVRLNFSFSLRIRHNSIPTNT